jgi:polyhydroxyalkanoate synthase
MLGYCMGGIFGLMYGAAFRTRAENLVTVATPVDFNGMGLLRHWADPAGLTSTASSMPSAISRLEGDAVAGAAAAVRWLIAHPALGQPLGRGTCVTGGAYRWVNDQILPRRVLPATTKELLWGNKLVTGELMLGSRKIDLKNIRASVLNAMAEHDHIAPYESTRSLVSLVGSCDKQEMLVKGGHVSLVSGKNAILRLWPTINQWLAPRSV